MGETPLVAASVVAFLAYVWLLTRATVPLVSLFHFASDGRPKLYAAFLAILVGAPGVLFVLPRARRLPAAPSSTDVRSRRQRAARRPSHLRTDLLGMALLLLAQVPLPAPWGPVGKAATIANVTKSPDLVEVSALFSSWSLGVMVLGVLAAVLAKVYNHAAGLRVIAIITVVGCPVIAWLVVVRAVS